MKAVDLYEQSRLNDTEMKFIFNLLEDHWNDGDRIVLVIESTLDICSNCRGYLAYLQLLAKEEGKLLEIKIITHPGAETTTKLNRLLNK